MKKSRVAVNFLPLLNSILFVLILGLLIFYIFQANFIYGSESTIEKYKKELGIYKEKYLELNEYRNLIYEKDIIEIKNALNMVEGKIADSVNIDQTDVALKFFQ